MGPDVLQGGFLTTPVGERRGSGVVRRTQPNAVARRDHAAHVARSRLNQVQSDGQGSAVGVGEPSDLGPVGRAVSTDLQEDRAALPRSEAERARDVHGVAGEHVSRGARNERRVEAAAHRSLRERPRSVRVVPLERVVCLIPTDGLTSRHRNQGGDVAEVGQQNTSKISQGAGLRL